MALARVRNCAEKSMARSLTKVSDLTYSRFTCYDPVGASERAQMSLLNF